MSGLSAPATSSPADGREITEDPRRIIQEPLAEVEDDRVAFELEEESLGTSSHRTVDDRDRVALALVQHAHGYHLGDALPQVPRDVLVLGLDDRQQR